MPIRAPSYSSADGDALAVEEGAVGRAEVGQARRVGQHDLGVPAGDAGVVEAQVGLAATAQDGVLMGQRERRGAQLQRGRDGRGRGGRGAGGRRRPGRDGLAAYAEDPGVEVVDELEPHRDRPDELVALLLGVLADHRGELGAQGLGVHRQPLVVVRPQLDGEVVGNHRAPAGDDRRPVVALALQRGRHLDGLHLGLERTREGAAHQAVEPPLEAVHDAHAHLLARSGDRPACGPRRPHRLVARKGNRGDDHRSGAPHPRDNLDGLARVAE